MMRAEIFDIQHFSVQDGPGIRTSVFMKGCPLACRWCHNPESQPRKPVLLYYGDKCSRCGMCLQVCENRVHEFGTGHILHRENCTVCGGCTAVCAENALRIAGRQMPVEELLREVGRDQMFYRESGGGVTFTGGEPLVQFPVLLTLLKRCKEEQIHTAVETSAYGASSQFREAAGAADLMICDIKAMDPVLHRELTGVDNALILKNIKALDQLRPGGYWIRIPLIPGCNDSRGELSQMAGYLRELHPQRIEILPYHDSGAAKYEAMGIEYPCSGTKVPKDRWKMGIKDIFREAGVDIII